MANEGIKNLKGLGTKGFTSVRLNSMAYVSAIKIQAEILEQTGSKIPLSVIIQKSLENFKGVIPQTPFFYND